MHAFDPNDYRKRVLAAVERRGGLAESDAFELYDIPLADAPRLSDADVAARVEQVWALWQKLRDHPKFRVLAGLLVEAHQDLSEPLLHTGSRLLEADRVKQLRDRRDAERYEMLDAAIERLIQRHNGIPAGKIAGLEDIGRLGGLTVAEVAARVRRHRIIDEAPAAPPPPAAPALSTERRRQIRSLLAEYERLIAGDPVPTLLSLLDMDFSAAHRSNEIRLRAEALRARTRELPPGRLRVVLDELLIHIGDLLEPGGPLVDAYLLTITETVTDQLRPQVRAAVLVEDLLVAPDFDYLLGVAIAGGLDRANAERVLIALADELGTTVEGHEHRAAGPRPTDSTHTDSATPSSNYPTGAARTPADGAGAAPVGAGTAGGAAGTGGGQWSSEGAVPPQGAADAPGAPEPEHWQRTPYDGTTQSGRPWEAALRAARASLRAGKPKEAAAFIADARRLVGDDAAAARSVRAVGEDVERVLAEAVVHWRAAVSCCAGRRFVEALAEHLDFLDRRAADVANPDPRGASRELLIGRARAAVIEAGRLFEALPADPGLRMQAVRAVLEVCADHAEARAALAELRVAAPEHVTVSRKPDGTVVITWTPSTTDQAEYRITRLLADGSWRVVGRTRGVAMEDGGAPAGPVPVYGVVASISGRASDMTRSDRTAAGAGAAASGGHRSGDASATGSRTVAGSAGSSTAGGSVGSSTATGSAGDRASASPDAEPSGLPTVRGLAERDGLLVFQWPTGITEVMVVARADAPPIDPDDPRARRWKVTNMRYEIEGGVRIPAEIPRPCHVAVASCRREPSGTLTVAAGFGAAARLRWVR
ncbi:Ig-like domain repeat protein [Nocardia sp. NPDC056611]|uniref:Ig-like domain repeat protein n=1 Tax=Nocardia sp. NPDC056611 TaxID=3345877 RepID=UPI00366C2E42